MIVRSAVLVKIARKHLSQHLRPLGLEHKGKYPQIYTVCHVWTFDFQLFSDTSYASFQHKSQKWVPKKDLSA